jgi:hypothetical protein
VDPIQTLDFTFLNVTKIWFSRPGICIFSGPSVDPAIDSALVLIAHRVDAVADLRPDITLNLFLG